MEFKKGDLKRYWCNYEGAKCAYSTFIAKCGRMSIEEAILPGIKGRVINVKHKEAYNFYHSYHNKKCQYMTFIVRVNKGMPFEEAINCHKLDRIIEDAPKKEVVKVRTFTPQEVKEIPESYCRIDITYPKEIAKIYNAVYLDEIEQLEEKIRQESQVIELKDKLKKLKEEYTSFLTFNKYTW